MAPQETTIHPFPGSRPDCRAGVRKSAASVRIPVSPNKRIALYARVSTSNSQQDPEMQLRELREYAGHRSACSCFPV